MSLIPVRYNPLFLNDGAQVIFRLVNILFLAWMLTGCASLVSGITTKMADDLSSTILNSDDVDTVREGVPAYLLLIDSFLRSSPDDPQLLLAASSLNGAFSSFTEGERTRQMTGKSLNYAFSAGCILKKSLCGMRALEFEEYEKVVSQLGTNQVPVAYAIGVAWAGWIQASTDDWGAIAELARVKLLMERIIELNEGYENGGPHLYMGGLETLFPASMGGKPEKGRVHFETALRLSNEKYLMTKVIFAQQYARLVFDQTLHDRLLSEVLAADPVSEGLTLINLIAQERAVKLLAESVEYF